MARNPEPLEAFASLTCLCGRVLSMRRSEALENTQRWRCATCKRRFIVAHIPKDGDHPATYLPVYLDGVPSTGDTVQEGVSWGDWEIPPPEHLRFQCRCGCRLVARGKSYSSVVICPRCASRLALRVAYRAGDGLPVGMVDYPDDHTIRS